MSRKNWAHLGFHQHDDKFSQRRMVRGPFLRDGYALCLFALSMRVDVGCVSLRKDVQDCILCMRRAGAIFKVLTILCGLSSLTSFSSFFLT